MSSAHLFGYEEPFTFISVRLNSSNDVRGDSDRDEDGRADEHERARRFATDAEENKGDQDCISDGKQDGAVARRTVESAQPVRLEPEKTEKKGA